MRMRDLIVQKRLDDYYSNLKRSWSSSLDASLKRIAEMVARLPDLDRLADDACDAANPIIQDSVNWGDLGCVEASVVVSLDEIYYQVLIEEASPDAYDFQRFVRDYLRERGFGNVRVHRNWIWPSRDLKSCPIMSTCSFLCLPRMPPNTS
jgi:hypothetical protein